MTNMPNGSRPADTATLEAARLLLDRLGVSPADLLADLSPQTAVPAFADYIPRVREAVRPGTRRVYDSYWNRIATTWGTKLLTEVTALEISQLAEQTQETAIRRANSTGGRSAAEHLLAALRCLYRHAIADGIIAESDNPAARIAKPRRLPSTRRALPDARLNELCRVAATTGNDPALDALLLRLHIETACRRGGALALMPEDLDPEQSLIRLHEKGGTTRWQPVSPTLMRHLIAHGQARRQPEPGQRLLRYANGQPITARRYDYLWQRLRQYLPWAATQQISTHWLRHTTLTWVERNFGFAIARAYAGHADRGRETNATFTYIRADIGEVAAALAALTGEPHPLAQQAPARSEKLHSE